LHKHKANRAINFISTERKYHDHEKHHPNATLSHHHTRENLVCLHAARLVWPLILKETRMHPDHNPMPFDAKRMLRGGFRTIVNGSNNQ
jgi:hypothetical protein